MILNQNGEIVDNVWRDLPQHYNNTNKKAKPMPYFNIVAQTSENTVVTEYEPAKARSECYQSKAELEELNKYKFSDTEWQK
jgi:hypothetical protein